LIFRAEQLV